MSMRALSTGSRLRCLLVALVATLAGERAAAAECEASGTLAAELLEQSGCQLSHLGITPLSDLGCGTYQGVEGGLYPGGAMIPPEDHRLEGWLAATAVVPRDSDGSPDATGGWVGFGSIGMSNTAIEFSAFQALVQEAERIHPRLVLVNGAQGGQPADRWADPASVVWSEFDQRLAAADLSPAQLQVVWIKQARAGPASLGGFPAHARALRDDLEEIVRIAKDRYENLAIAYLSSRTRAYTTVTGGLSPEPFAYESGFAVKRLISDQIAGFPSLRFAGSDPPAPWLAWGPYLWADGEVPRKDGFSWDCTDTAADFTHPSPTGAAKVAEELMIFLDGEPTAGGWFHTPRRSCGLLGVELFPAFFGLGLSRAVRRRPRWQRWRFRGSRDLQR